MMQHVTRGYFKVVLETPGAAVGQILSSSGVQAGPRLSAMCGRLLSRCGMGSTLTGVWCLLLAAVGWLTY